MRWSWKLVRIAGIDVYMHVTFLILVAWVGWIYYRQTHSWIAMLGGLFFIAILFGIVVLHELGHALAARRYGIRTRDITLLPIGGVARLERMPTEPRQELVVALAGPAVNVALAVALFLLLVPISGLAALSDVTLVGGQMLAKLIFVNVVLAVFNMLPAFPMDGGRVLRALLAMRQDYVQATQTAATIGQAMAFVFGLLGLVLPNPFLLFIALFVWVGAAEEAGMVQMRSAMGGIPVSRAMIKDFRVLSPEDSLGQAVQHILAGFQQDFPVVDGERLVGVLTRGDLLTALPERGQESRVAEAMRTDFETADPLEMLEGVLSRLQGCGCRSLPVVWGSHVVGIVTTDNLGEFLMVQSALRGLNR